MKYANVYVFNPEKELKNPVSRRTGFRKLGKRGFLPSKKLFVSQPLFNNSNKLLLDDGAIVEPNIHNYLLFRRLRKYYPIY